MKSDLNIKILKLSIAEIVMQSGFERISEQALNILGDLFKFYSEQILLKIKKMNKDHSFSIESLVNEFSLPSHQITELISFLNTQLSLKKSLGVKEEDESLLHTLKVIPKSVDLSNVFRNTSSFNLNLSFKNGSSNLNLELDLEMEKFIKENLKNKKGKEKEKIEYKFNLIEIIKDIKNGGGGGGMGKMDIGDLVERRKVFRR